jgi:hypothetical protein
MHSIFLSTILNPPFTGIDRNYISNYLLETYCKAYLNNGNLSLFGVQVCEAYLSRAAHASFENRNFGLRIVGGYASEMNQID